MKRLFLLLLLTSPCLAQTPTYTGPDLRDQLVDLLRENKALKTNLRGCDSLLTLTLDDVAIVVREKDKRYARLDSTYKAQLTTERARTQQAINAANQLRDGLVTAERDMADEALTSRLLGWRRKHYLKLIRSKVILTLDRLK